MEHTGQPGRRREFQDVAPVHLFADGMVDVSRGLRLGSDFIALPQGLADVAGNPPIPPARPNFEGFAIRRLNSRSEPYRRWRSSGYPETAVEEVVLAPAQARYSLRIVRAYLLKEVFQ
jgi:hypothetical protein